MFRLHQQKSAADHDAAEKILRDLTLEWSVLVPEATPELEVGYREAAEQALIELGIDDQSMFDVVNVDAVAFAKQRAAELVTQISETTRERLGALVTNALTEGASWSDLADSIEESHAFSAERAEMIARTELGFAHVQGNIAAWKQTDVVSGYEWILGSEHETPDECDDNDGEFVELGGTFPSGDDAPPLHPNCVCALLPVLKEADE